MKLPTSKDVSKIFIYTFLYNKTEYLTYPKYPSFFLLQLAFDFNGVITKEDKFYAIYCHLQGMGNQCKRKYGFCNSAIFNEDVNVTVKQFKWLDPHI